MPEPERGGIHSEPEKNRNEYLAKLPDATRAAAETLYAQYDAVEQIRRQAEKDVVAEAHRHPISRMLETDPLHQDYQRLTAAGTKPNLAKLTIARKIAAITLSMWKSKEKYDPTKYRKPSS